MNTDEQLVRGQLEETERANAAMLKEIKRLNAMRSFVELRISKIKADTDFLPSIRYAILEELEGILAALKGEANG